MDAGDEMKNKDGLLPVAKKNGWKLAALALLSVLAIGAIGFLVESTEPGSGPEENEDGSASDDAGHRPRMASRQGNAKGIYSPLSNVVGMPASVEGNAAAQFRFFRDCAKFHRFDAFYTEKAADPTWALNDPDALAEMSSERRQRILDIMEFVEESRSDCEPWVENTPRDLANAQIYASALNAALSGNEDATACFILASWQEPGRDSKYYRELKDAYATHTPAFVREGVGSGRWSIVFAVNQAIQQEHRLTASARFDTKDKYFFSRLAQLGADDAESQSLYGDQAASYARYLPIPVVVEQDQRASSLFTTRFRRDEMDAQTVTDMCVN